jgi:hypothetical protein
MPSGFDPEQLVEGVSLTASELDQLPHFCMT